MFDGILRRNAIGAGIGAQQNDDGHNDVERHEDGKRCRCHAVRGADGVHAVEDALTQLQANLYPQHANGAPDQAMEHVGAPIEVEGDVQVAPRNHAPECFHGPAGEVLKAAAHYCAHC